MSSKRLGYFVTIFLAIGVALLLYVKSRPSPAITAFKRGESLLAVNMQNEAGDTFLEATRLDPKYAPPYRALAELAMQVNAFPLAAEYWQKYVKLDTKAKEAYSQLAYTQMMMGQEPSAYKSAEEELKRNPESAQAHLTLGIINARRSAAKLALEHLEIAANAYQSNSKVQLAFAKVLALTGNLDRAEQILTGILAKDKSYAEPYYWLGYLYARRIETPENLKAAEKNLRTSLDLQPLFPQANLEIAKLYLRQKRYDLALTHVNRAIQHRKHYPAALFVQQKALEGLGKTAEAQKAQENLRVETQLAERGRALLRQYSGSPDNLDIIYALIQTQLDLEQPESAMRFLQDAMRRAPNDPRFQQALKRAQQVGEQQAKEGQRQDMQLSIGEDLSEKK